MSQITQITITGTYQGERTELITYAKAAQLAGCSRQYVKQAVRDQCLASDWLSGSRKIKVVVRRQWESLINQESK